ncbi:piggyBac transposable element-derived protein 4-like [Biomphalaria glabrata]|uniref:PiggyBac transposable element-derived protein 4-like n=1 Tax=Biomphalaria glabrata TaxID=6526 RepID=A0A9W3B6D9_BIOGL|nr:piggyBac transposable element-derived protein 4-like [Biomphalaria glabrata]XP_055895079.1 piggyBac transposable element-derived protein 4-like [Biomphalaria glabrata]
MAQDLSSDEEIEYISSEDEEWIEEEFHDDENIQPNFNEQRNYGSYDDLDQIPHAIPAFRPERPPGAHFPDSVTRQNRRNYLTPLSIFKLFFTEALVEMLCKFTNENAAATGPSKPSMYKNWKDIDVEEFYVFMGLLMYMGLVQVPNFKLYWNGKSLFNGLWARAFMTRFRFQQILCFLKVSNRDTEVATDKLAKVRFLFEFIRRKCMKLYQPSQNISIDERMVRNKGRYAFRQYIRDKPTKWGMKLWVLADSLSGYTYDFDVYLGKIEGNSSTFGLAYDVVMKLVSSLVNQGYRLFFDNFYTSFVLVIDLFKKGIVACGTIISNRKGFPTELKNVKQWEKVSKRGDMRWVRQDQVLAMQWRDNKTVSLVSTMHSANEFNYVNRRTKNNGVFEQLKVKQPQLVGDYNSFMGGVDKSDQLLNKYNMLRKTNKYWKTLFFHFIDIARVNSYILFQDWRKQNPDIEELNRSPYYSQLDFTIELIRELANIDDYDPVPTIEHMRLKTCHSILPAMVASKDRKNCKLCYSHHKIERKTRSMCSACGTFLCFSPERNCLLLYHK